MAARGLLGWSIGALACLLFTAGACAEPTPLNSAVILFDDVTLRRGELMVDRAAALGNRRVMVVVTMHCRLTPELRVTEYGLVGSRELQWRAPLRPDNFLVMDDPFREEFTGWLTKVFKRAVLHRMDIAVLPHLDAYGQVEEWRNLFDFDPLQTHQGESYASALIEPTIEALNRSITPQTSVQFALSGEMGKSLFAYPEQYEKLTSMVRQRVKSERLEVGVSLNHNDVASDHRPTAAQRAVLKRLFGGLDFVGFSHYRPFAPPPRVSHFTEACDGFLAALRTHGIEVPKKTPLHFSEIAIGGNPDQAGGTSPRLAAEKPWEGTGELRRNPWRTPGMQAFRRAYHDRLLEFLRTQPASHHVAAAYMWSENSWDPQGVDGRRFVDEEIIEAIRRHNTAVASRKRQRPE